MTGSSGNGGDSDYHVGYRKPPKHTQFQAGRSGNPKGRPKSTRNLKTDLVEELGERILVREGERAHHISKQRAFVKALTAKALKVEPKAATLLVSMMWRLLDTQDAVADVETPLPENPPEMISMDEARDLVGHVLGLAIRFAPREKHDELFTAFGEFITGSSVSPEEPDASDVQPH